MNDPNKLRKDANNQLYASNTPEDVSNKMLNASTSENMTLSARKKAMYCLFKPFAALFDASVN